MYVERVAGVTSFVLLFFVWFCGLAVSLPVGLLSRLCFCLGLFFGLVFVVIFV